MYPMGRKLSVKVARPLTILRELVGDDRDFQWLFDMALICASNRVVVKRPYFADPITSRRLMQSLTGKLVRYDIYQGGR